MQKAPLITATLTAVLLITTSLTQAQELTKQERSRVESIGVVSGLVVGAIAGGPPGAVATAAFGGWVSDKVLAARENKLLKSHMASNRAELQSLQEEHTELQLDLARARRELDQRQLTASINAVSPSVTCCSDTELTLHFRSNSAQVETLYDDALQQFVNLPTKVMLSNLFLFF